MSIRGPEMEDVFTGQCNYGSEFSGKTNNQYHLIEEIFSHYKQ